MLSDSLTDRLRRALRELRRLHVDRHESETDIQTQFERDSRTAAQNFESDSAVGIEDNATQAGALARKRREAIDRIRDEFESGMNQARQTARELRDTIKQKSKDNENAARSRLQEAVWMAESVYEAHEHKPQEKLDEALAHIERLERRLYELVEAARHVVRQYRQKPHDLDSRDAATVDADPTLAQAEANIDELATHVQRLRSLRLPRLFTGGMPHVCLIFLPLIGPAVTGLTIGFSPDNWLPIAGSWVSALIVVLAAGYFAYRSSAKTIANIFGDISTAVQLASHTLHEFQSAAEKICRDEEEHLLDQRNAETRIANEKFRPVLEEIKQRTQRFLDKIDERFQRQVSEFERKRNTALRDVDEQFNTLASTQQTEQTERIRRIEADYETLRRDIRTKYEADFSSLQGRWRNGAQQVQDDFNVLFDALGDTFATWSDPSWNDWSPPMNFSKAVPIGELVLDRSTLPGGLASDERLAIPMDEVIRVPALVEFPNSCSAVLQSDGGSRTHAIEMLRMIMFRLLTAVPPGKVRFTIIDPVGLGQNFAGFMHLADYDSALVTDRIWTETRHIEQRLLDLTEHMENVIQKYLRNEFETIDQYNVEAGEIAEPYRFLIIADFPINFSDDACRRLASIINSGARCGVYTLIHQDMRHKLPAAMDQGDLAKGSAKIVWKDGHLSWDDDDFRELPLRVDGPPPDEMGNRILHAIGKAAKDSSRVEVPFESIGPRNDQLWTESTSETVTVSLGRAGATRLQQLSLGLGTSQHALIAGKTGSGKSTLLHVLITNLAMWFDPNEIEFYLVDFKKGVEFKTYATNQLPHARVVAIETDREFGLSVLQRVDNELKHRGDRFRELGVQNLPGFRSASPQERMPRTLLIIDEFQELFVEDDKLSQDAALLLDRIVRQGRAFGLHVILGSQTLGGAYSLARSTIGQMGVRIALQCNESDSYLILNDDNAAARLLARPGEAIYNDAGGRLEGNSPFQIAWLSDSKRDALVQTANHMAIERAKLPPTPQIVFEGNVPADVARNHLLEQFLSSTDGIDEKAEAYAWLGDAIAIKDPTAAAFRRQSGAHLLIAGQREEAALSMMLTSLYSLAAQHRRDGATFVILDGSPADSTHAGLLEHAASLLPHETKCIAWRDVGQAMADIAREMDQRSSRDTAKTSLYVFIYGLQRYRMLRAEDDFGFSMSSEEKPPSEDKIFGRLLTEGPQLGMHTLVWCDTMNNIDRALGRQRLREFEMRALFQMSASDSTSLIDSPVAAKLGLKRAVFHSEELGTVEKFRPYAMPSRQWIEEASAKLRDRAAATTPDA